MTEGVVNPFVSPFVVCVSVGLFSSSSLVICLVFLTVILGVCCVRTWGVNSQSAVCAYSCLCANRFGSDLCNKVVLFFPIEVYPLLRFYRWGFNEANPIFQWSYFENTINATRYWFRSLLTTLCLVWIPFVTLSMVEFVVLTQPVIGSRAFYFSFGTYILGVSLRRLFFFFPTLAWMV